MISPFDNPRFNRWAPAILAALLFLFVFALYYPVCSYDLVHVDDIAYVTNNAAIHDGLSAAGIRQAFSLHNPTATMYMPLLWISYMMDIEWLGSTPVSPLGFHFTNVLLHALNAVLVFGLLWGLARRPGSAFFLAALWAVHPLRVESVAWVSERKDVLSGFFGLLCLVSYVWAGRHTRPTDPPSPQSPSPLRLSASWYFASLLFFGLGLLTKPGLAPVPFVLFLLDFWPLRRLQGSSAQIRQVLPRLLLEKAPFFLLAGLAAYGTILGHRSVSGAIAASWDVRLQAIPLSMGFYVWKTLLPHGLTILYPHWTIWLSRPLAIMLALASTSVLAALTTMAWRSRHRRPNQLVGWFWFLGMLIPVSGIIPIPTNDVADRFSYLPAVGLSIFLLSLKPWPPLVWRVHRRTWLVLGIGVLGLLSALTLQQLPAWQNAAALNSRVLQVFPDHATALETQAGHLLRSTGDFPEADRLLTKALRSDPLHWKAHIAKAQCIWAIEGPYAARNALQKMTPPTSRFTLSQWHRDLARYSLMLGQPEDALHHADQSLALLPAHDHSLTPILLLAMAAAFEEEDMPRALSYARRFPPYAHKTTLELADLLPHYIFQWAAGYRQDTCNYFQRLLQAHPNRPDYLNNVVWGLATADWSPADPQEVLEMAHRLAGMFPDPNPGILDTLGAAQANAGRFDEAARTMCAALALLPQSADPGTKAFRERLTTRLQLYEQAQPYREDAFARMYSTYYGPTAAQPR